MINPLDFSYSAITIDLDWAPDFAISFTSAILLKNHVRATWFITHDSPAVRNLMAHPDLFEVGIHPNFMPGSTQGKTITNVLENMLKIVPDAKSARTHGLFQSSNIMREMAVNFHIENDVSIFLWQTPYILPTSLAFNAVRLMRIPYFWAEEEEMAAPMPFSLENRFHNWPGLRVYNFHPIHVFLNSGSIRNYQQLKSNRPLQECRESDAEPFANYGPGCRSFFTALVDHLAESNKSQTISQIANKFRKRCARA
jgi:hypothetical protein